MPGHHPPIACVTARIVTVIALIAYRLPCKAKPCGAFFCNRDLISRKESLRYRGIKICFSVTYSIECSSQRTFVRSDRSRSKIEMPRTAPYFKVGILIPVSRIVFGVGIRTMRCNGRNANTALYNLCVERNTLAFVCVATHDRRTFKVSRPGGCLVEHCARYGRKLRFRWRICLLRGECVGNLPTRHARQLQLPKAQKRNVAFRCKTAESLPRRDPCGGRQNNRRAMRNQRGKPGRCRIDSNQTIRARRDKGTIPRCARDKTFRRRTCTFRQ